MCAEMAVRSVHVSQRLQQCTAFGSTAINICQTQLKNICDPLSESRGSSRVLSNWEEGIKIANRDSEEEDLTETTI